MTILKIQMPQNQSIYLLFCNRFKIDIIIVVLFIFYVIMYYDYT